MLSRVADSLYWMSRYLERAEHMARVVNVNLNLTLDRAPQDAARHWGRLLLALPEPPPWAPRSASDFVERATVDLANRESIAACIGAARENARQVREEISTEMWEEVNRLFLHVRGNRVSEREWTAGTHEFLTSTIGGVQMFQGVTDATMTHGEGWHFIELGRYVERTSSTAALLEVQFRECAWDDDQELGVSEYVEWVGLLKSCCAFEAYCRHYTADVRTRRIAEFLVLNDQFPRSIHFAVRCIKSSLAALAERSGRANGRADRLAGRLKASLDYGQVDEIIGELPAFLQGIVRQASQINSAVYQQYIAYPIESALAG
ncbi:MAG: alpha-E domain-containing protein [Vicinamibacterales bacterium]